MSDITKRKSKVETFKTVSEAKTFIVNRVENLGAVSRAIEALERGQAAHVKDIDTIVLIDEGGIFDRRAQGPWYTLKQKQDMYRNDEYVCSAPQVCTFYWDINSWVKHIDACKGWRPKK